MVSHFWSPSNTIIFNKLDDLGDRIKSENITTISGRYVPKILAVTHTLGFASYMMHQYTIIFLCFARGRGKQFSGANLATGIILVFFPQKVNVFSLSFCFFFLFMYGVCMVSLFICFLSWLYVHIISASHVGGGILF